MAEKNMEKQQNKAQYEGFSSQKPESAVNLFQGEVAFSYPLADGLPKKDGFGANISAAYSSSTAREAGTDNLTEASGVMGLGWSFGYPCIMRGNTRQLLPKEQETFYYTNTSGRTSRLFLTDYSPTAASLEKEWEEELKRKSASAKLVQKLGEWGIAVTKGASLEASADEYRLMDDKEELALVFSKNGDGSFDVFYDGLFFEPSNFDFSQIIYFETYEKWLVINKDGTQSVFGRKSAKDALEYMVHYHGSLLPASGTEKQEQAVIRWNLSKERSIWDDEVTYSYQQDMRLAAEGGLTFTRACYLSEITDWSGFRIVFSYGDKEYGEDVKEYFNPNRPYTNKPLEGADCYQSRFETKYLDSVQIFYPDGKLAEKKEFAYSLVDLADTCSIKGAGVKRLLTSVTRTLSSGGKLPPEKFFYETGDDSNTGALCRIVMKTGTEVNYQYTQKELPNCSLRSTNISKEGFTSYKIWNGGDYSAVLLYNNTSSLFRLYGWFGRFQAWTPSTWYSDQNADKVEAMLLEDAVVLSIPSEGNDVTKIVCYRKDTDILGGWVEEVSEEFPTENCRLTGGDGFFLVTEQENGRMTRYTYDMLNRKTVKEILTGDTSHAYITAACGERYVLLDYDVSKAAGEKTSVLSVYAKNGYGEWDLESSVSLPDLDILYDETTQTAAVCIAFSGNLCAVASASDTSRTSFYYTLTLWETGTEGLVSLYRKDRAVSGQKDVWEIPKIAWEPCISGQLVLCGGTVLAVDAEQVWENDTLSTDEFDFSTGTVMQAVGESYIIQSRVTDGDDKIVLAQALHYNPDQPEQFACQEPVVLDRENPEKMKKGGYVPTIYGTIGTFDGTVYDLTQEEPFDIPMASLSVGSSQSLIHGKDMLIYEDSEKQVYEVRIKNGKLQQTGTLKGSMPETAGGTDVFNIEEDNGLTLYKNTGDSFVKPVTYYQVSGAVTNDGCAKTGKVYEYQDSSAVCDSSGSFVKYYITDIYNDTDKKNGFTRYRYRNSLASVFAHENANMPYLLDGMLEENDVCDSSGKVLSKVSFTYQFDRNIAEKPGGERTRKIYGAVLTSSVSDSTENGVTSKVETTYDAYTGETKSVTSAGCNVFGNKIKETRYTYSATEENPVLVAQNRLRETAKIVTEWQKDDGDIQTAEASRVTYEMFSGKKRSVLSGNKIYRRKSGDNWEEKSCISRYDSMGNVLVQKSSKGMWQIKRYDKSGFFHIGSVTNEPTEGNTLMLSFEDYDQTPEEWEKYRSKETSVAGEYSLKIPSGTQTDAVSHTVKGGKYAAAFFSIGSADLTITGNGVTVSARNVEECGDVSYNIVSFSAEKSGEISLLFENSSGEDVYVDLFCVFTFDYPPMQKVYRDYLVDADISGYGEMTRYLYDRRRQLLCVMERDLAPSLTIPYYSSLARFDHDTQYNAEIILKYTEKTLYRRKPEKDEEISLSDAKNEEKAVAAYVDVLGTEDAKLTLGEVSVEFAKGTWTLTCGSTVMQKSGVTGDGEWLLYAGSRILFFVDGEIVFEISDAEYGDPLELSLSGENTFGNLLCGKGAAFGIRYLDTEGRVHQGQMLEENGMVVTQNFYDSENRLIAKTKPVTLSGMDWGYIEDFAFLDASTGIMTGRVADAYPEDEGFAYVSQRYEATPMGRLVECGLPGKNSAINPSVPFEERKTAKRSYEPVSIPGLSLKSGEYHYNVIDSPEGKRTVSVLNANKQQVAMAVTGGDSSVISSSDVEYTSEGSVKTTYLPNYFSGNKKAVRTSRFDVSGRLVSDKDPCCDEEAQYGYDKHGELRFARTPECVAEGKFFYRRLDSLYRIVEEGYCYDDWDEALSKVDSEDYPDKNYSKLRTYEFGTDIADLGAISNLTVVHTWNEDGTEGAVYRYSYDSSGRQSAVTVQIEDGQEFTERVSYDIEGNVVSIVNAEGKEVHSGYDLLGRKKWEKLEDDIEIAGFTYDASDRISTMQTKGGETTYTYTSEGWIQKIKAPLMEETLTYEGARISEFTVELKVESKEVPTSVRYKVAYDDFGRLTEALCYNGEIRLDDMSIQKVTYDENGNIQSIQSGQKLSKYYYASDSDRLLGVDSQDDFSYNADGAVTAAESKGIKKIEYENERPVRFSTDNGTFSVFYDASGNRAEKVMPDGSRKVFLYNGQKRVSQEISLPEGKVTQYLYGQFGLRAMLDSQGVKDIYTDHLGSPRVVGEGEKPIAAAQYTPYGEMLRINGKLPFGFNGYGLDEETGLYYSGHRLYDPKTGRFYAMDPDRQAESPYVFCGNDPINRIDPEGDSWWSILLGAVVGIIGVAVTVATAGAACPALLASESALAAETVVGTVAGAVGSVTGSLVTAACDNVPITGKMVLGAAIGGAVGGLGTLAGPLAQGGMRLMYNTMRAAGNFAMASIPQITCTGAAIGCVVGAAAGVAGNLASDAVMGMPVSATSLVVAGLAGMGSGLLASRAVYGFASAGGTPMLPIMLKNPEMGLIRPGGLGRFGAGEGTGLAAFVPPGSTVQAQFQARFGSARFFSFIDDGTFCNVGRTILSRRRQNNLFAVRTVNGGVAPQDNACIIAAHGFGRHCFAITMEGAGGESFEVFRPMAGSSFVNYFQQTYNEIIQGSPYVKLLICFSGSSPGGTSTAQKFANALNMPVYATRGVAYPTQFNQVYQTFYPRLLI